MEEMHIWDIIATFQPHSLGTGDKFPPCFKVLFGRVQQCYIIRDPTIGDFKSNHLQARVTLGLFTGGGGGGGHVPLRSHLGLALQISHFYIVKLEFTREYIFLFFFFFGSKTCLWF